MTECFNTEFKEQLPELAGEQLDPVTRARVEEHVASCEACADELEILRIVRESVIPAPYVNVSRIVRSLPPAPVPVNDELPWYRRASFQMAAAFLLVAGGLFSARQAGDRVESASVAAAPASSIAVSVQSSPADAVGAPPASPTSSAPERRVANASPNEDIALVSGLDEMTTAELASLLVDVDGMAALPVAEPEEFSPVIAVSDTQGDN